MFKAIIFDLGNVLINVSAKRAYEHWGEIARLEPDELAKRCPIDHVFDCFERGEIEPAVFREHVMNKMDLRLTETEFDNGWNQILIDPLPGMDGVMAQLKENYRLALLSNTNKIHADLWKVKHAAYLSNLEAIFTSHEIGTRKPEPKAFGTVLDYLGVLPEEAIFVDDLPGNVTGAEQMGLKGIIMKTPEQLVLELQSLGIEIHLPSPVKMTKPGQALNL